MAVHSLELANDTCDDDGHPARTANSDFKTTAFYLVLWLCFGPNFTVCGTQSGTLWSCVAHIITAVIGSGVLSLAWSTSQLEWIAGPTALLIFANITYLSAFLLSDCYRTDDGKRNKSYMEAVELYLGS